MRHVLSVFWMPALGAALAATVAGCGGATAPAPSSTVQAPNSSTAAPSQSRPPVDPNVAFQQYEASLLPFGCSPAFSDISDAASDNDIEAMKLHAGTYRELLAVWHSELGKIAFPDAAQPIADKIGELITIEQTDLDVVTALDGDNDPDLFDVSNKLGFDDWAIVAESDRLVAALGHPEHPARFAANQLELAYRTFYADLAGVWAKFEDALQRNDLAAAKAANKIEEDAAQRYIDRIDTIHFPPGFGGQVETLKGHLRGIIENNRGQVDVTTTAQIVRTPDEGAPEAIAADDAQTTLFNDLRRVAFAEDPSPPC